MSCYGFDPHEIARHTPSRLLTRLRRQSTILKRSVERLLASARASVTSTPDGPRREFHRAQLAQVWQDWQLHEARRDEARAHLETLYDQARILDPRLPKPVHGVVSKPMLARLFGELGPIRDFNHWRQVLRYAGLNLRERQSGKYVGVIRIARKGRPQLRRILNQIALPLVRSGCLFGAYFHHKRQVHNMPGPKVMTAVSRKLVKMFWGWIQSGEAFDAKRVFTCQGEHARAAA
jgi:transposase